MVSSSGAALTLSWAAALQVFRGLLGATAAPGGSFNG